MQYVDVWKYDFKTYPFHFFIGGRGTGKTYSALKGTINRGLKPVYMRRTDTELESICDSSKDGEGANPFKVLNKDLNMNIGFKLNKKFAGLYNREVVEGQLQHTGAPIGYGVALSTVAGLRSLDFSDADVIIYDEFITEKHIRKIKNEGEAMLNAYETIARNKELQGLDPIPMICLANSNNIYNPIFIELGIVSTVEKMMRKGKRDCYIKERGLAIHLLMASDEFVKAKSESALYKLTKGTKFYDMALSNDFAFNDFSLVGYKKLDGYIPICGISGAYLYKKKGSTEYHFSYAPAKVKTYNANTLQGIRAFNTDYGISLVPIFSASKLTFESIELKERILDIIL